MKRLLLIMSLVLAIPLAASAAPAPVRSGPADEGGPGKVRDREKNRKEKREKVERRLRLLRTAELADALDLPEAEALKLSAEMGRFDEKRAPLRDQLREARQVVKRAAEGDADAAKKLDDALRSATEVRKKMADLDLDEYRALAKLVPAEKHGKLAQFSQQFRKEVKKLMRRAREHGGRERGGGGGPDDE